MRPSLGEKFHLLLVRHYGCQTAKSNMSKQFSSRFVCVYGNFKMLRRKVNLTTSHLAISRANHNPTSYCFRGLKKRRKDRERERERERERDVVCEREELMPLAETPLINLHHRVTGKKEGTAPVMKIEQDHRVKDCQYFSRDNLAPMKQQSNLPIRSSNRIQEQLP
jgi:hypothetical protein